MEEKQQNSKAFTGLLRAVCSRTTVVILLMLLQIGIFIAALYYLAEYGWLAYGLMACISIGVVIYIINEEGNPAFKLAWMIPILSLPLLGCGFYLFCKLQTKTKFLTKRLARLWIESRDYRKQNEDIIESIKREKPANARLAYFLSNQVGYPMHRNTKVTYYALGEDKFKAMLEELNKAEKFIFMEYFIVEHGLMWSSILEVLERKAKEGVEVRMMYDGMCCIAMLPYHYPQEIEKKGIQCKMFSPIKPVLTTVQNNRDHRKICIIDGKVGFTGGVNLGDEYINHIERFGHWKDTAVLLEGEAVQSLTMMFLQMWNVDEKKADNYEAYLTPASHKVNPSLGYVLPYGDSPYDNENVGEEVYQHILNHAKKYVHIVTPYLIIDNEMLTTLTNTAKSGIEVIIIMPHIPDKAYAFAVAKTYYTELIEAGVQIYEYTPGFVHAKMFISDDDTATVGTINLDYRSLYLHFECGTFIYNNPVVQEIEEDFQETLAKCQKVSLLDVKNRKITEKVMGNVCRLFAPLM